MPTSPPEPPDLTAARPERKPSVWRPQPVPTPGRGRSTEDPRTPRLSELAAREMRASLISASRGAGAGTPAADPGALTPAECPGAWNAIEREMAPVLRAGGNPRAGPVDVLRRNQAITAEYARLYQADPRLRWAGVAAFASKQVGCGIEDARAIANAPEGVLERLPPISVPVAAGQTAAEAQRAAARHMEAALGRGNEAVFRDIYPTHRFYQEHGLDGLRTCAADRPGGRVPPQVMRGFEELDAGTNASMRSGAQRVLRYEQRETLQAAVYDDRTTALLLRANQAAFKAGQATRWVGGDRLARAAGVRPVEVNFTSGCAGTPSERFDDWNLADFEQRWPYAQRVADRFHTMVEGAGAGQIRRELGVLAARGR